MSGVHEAPFPAGSEVTAPAIDVSQSKTATPDVDKASSPASPQITATVVNEAFSPAGSDVTVPVSEASLPVGSDVTVPVVNEASLPAGPEFTVPVVTEASLPACPDVTIPVVDEASFPAGPEVTVPVVTEASLPAGPDLTIPVIDASLLSSTDPDDRAKAVRDLGKACEEWGFFMLVNHDIAETLMDRLLGACEEFSDLSEEEKRQLGETKNPKFPMKIMSTAGTNPATGKTLYWRNYIMFFAHPELCCPEKPKQLGELASEYGKRIRFLTRKLLGGISESLGLKEEYIKKTMEMDSAAQMFVVNCYPPCPEPDPESAIGIPPHTDHGLLTFVIQNGVQGLDILHGEKWFHVNPIPGSILVNVGDQLEVVTNGKCKSVWHRALVNNSKKRISVAVVNGPSPDIDVAPAPALIGDGSPAKYAPMNYLEYIKVQKSTRPDMSATWPRFGPTVICGLTSTEAHQGQKADQVV